MGPSNPRSRFHRARCSKPSLVRVEDTATVPPVTDALQTVTPLTQARFKSE
jgi:hypothetical protein